MTEICQKCREEGKDRITLWMACFYEMNELNIPFEKDTLYTNDYPRCDGYNFYTLRVCKNCRSDWMRSIQYWFNTQMPIPSPGSETFVRDLGINKQMTLVEYRKKYGGKDE